MAATPRGHSEQLPSGSSRVHVYAGTDPVTGKPRRIRETCPDDAAAATTLGRLLAEVDQERFPDRGATLGHALDKYIEVADLEVSTREAHEGYIRRTIKPVLGQVKIRKLGADSLDGLYAATLDELHLCPPRPAGVVDELRLTLCSTLSERTSAYGFKAAPKGRSRRRPSLPLLPAKTPVGWREEIMTGVA